MWHAKYHIVHENCVYTPKCVKHHVTDYVYMLNAWSNQEHYYYTLLHLVQGTEQDKQNYIQALKKDKRLKQVDVSGNTLLTLNVEPREREYLDPLFDKRLFQVKPIIVHPRGYEIWELASYQKDILTTVKNVPDFEVEIEFIKRISPMEIFLPNLYPKLASKQQAALELAVKHGYYAFPRKIHLERLAKLAGVTRQTYQENLRKAEKKLIGFLTEYGGY